MLFNTSITLVSCFYNLNRESWVGFSRSIEVYFENCQAILSKYNPIVVFTTDEYKERITSIRSRTDPELKYTQIIIKPFHRLRYYDLKERISSIQKNNLHNLPIGDRKSPEFINSDYLILINNKTWLLREAYEMNNFESTIFQWVDFGLHKNTYNFDNSLFDCDYFNRIEYNTSKIRIAGFRNTVPHKNRKAFYNTHIPTLASGLMAIPSLIIRDICDKHDAEFMDMLASDCCNQENYNYLWLVHHYPDNWDFYLMDGWNDLGHAYSTNRNLVPSPQPNKPNIAFCFSGHMRTYLKCKDSIKTNIITPIIKAGFNIYAFCSTWKDDDSVDMTDFIMSEIETYDGSLFTKYATQQYKRFQWCQSSTSSNSASMLYKISKVYDLAKSYALNNNLTYDIIVRIRPDIVFKTPLETNLLNKEECVYMPEHHGRYEPVTKLISDQFFFGHPTQMETIMRTYQSIGEFIQTDCPHTAEGFIWAQQQKNNIKFNRFPIRYGLLRSNGKIEAICQ